jgi:anti-sigma regulatory factor (Ser/Thr protein kinase)
LFPQVYAAAPGVRTGGLNFAFRSIGRLDRCPATQAGGSTKVVGAIVSVGEGFHGVREAGRRQVRRVELPNDARSVKVARDTVASTLAVMGWPEHAIDRARVVASELVTNAVLHTASSVELTVRVDDECFIEVSDDAPAELPQLAERGELRPGGMGLYLVEALASEWGVERDPGRKVVWARMARQAVA